MLAIGRLPKQEQRGGEVWSPPFCNCFQDHFSLTAINVWRFLPWHLSLLHYIRGSRTKAPRWKPCTFEQGVYPSSPCPWKTNLPVSVQILRRQCCAALARTCVYGFMMICNAIHFSSVELQLDFRLSIILRFYSKNQLFIGWCSSTNHACTCVMHLVFSVFCNWGQSQFLSII